MRILMNAAFAAALLLQAGTVQAQTQADMALRMHEAMSWCHVWVRQGTLTSIEQGMADLGFVEESDGAYGWDGGRPGEQVFRVEFWDIDGEHSCHLNIEPGAWDVAELGRDLTAWARSHDAYVSVPAQSAHPNGVLSHFRDGDLDLVITTSPDGAGLAGYVMAISLWTGMSRSE